jgi:hypothetical protein
VLAVVADPQGTDSLSGSLEKCVAPSVAAFIDSLNERTTAHARRRFVEADKPRLLAAAMHSMRRFLTSYFWDGRFRSGWTGLQIAFLEAVFAWLEETKLRQMSSEFRTGDEAQRSIQAMPAHSPTVPLARSKAA